MSKRWEIIIGLGLVSTARISYGAGRAIRGGRDHSSENVSIAMTVRPAAAMTRRVPCRIMDGRGCRGSILLLAAFVAISPADAAFEFGSKHEAVAMEGYFVGVGVYRQ